MTDAPSPAPHVLAPSLVIGRDPGADITVDDAEISTHHAELRRSPAGGHLLVDTRSTNGTFVNDVRVTRGGPAAGRRRPARHAAGLPLRRVDARAAVAGAGQSKRPAGAAAVGHRPGAGAHGLRHRARGGRRAGARRADHLPPPRPRGGRAGRRPRADRPGLGQRHLRQRAAHLVATPGGRRHDPDRPVPAGLRRAGAHRAVAPGAGLPGRRLRRVALGARPHARPGSEPDDPTERARGARRRQRRGQEHAAQDPRRGVRPDRGQRPVQRHRPVRRGRVVPQRHRLRAAERHRPRRPARRPGPRLRRPAAPAARPQPARPATPDRRDAGRGRHGRTAAQHHRRPSPAASESACRWRSSCSRTPRCCCSTSPPAASTPASTSGSWSSSAGWPTRGAPSSWSPTRCCTSTAATASRSWPAAAGSPTRARPRATLQHFQAADFADCYRAVEAWQDHVPARPAAGPGDAGGRAASQARAPPARRPPARRAHGAQRRAPGPRPSKRAPPAPAGAGARRAARARRGPARLLGGQGPRARRPGGGVRPGQRRRLVRADQRGPGDQQGAGHRHAGAPDGRRRDCRTCSRSSCRCWC